MKQVVQHAEKKAGATQQWMDALEKRGESWEAAQVAQDAFEHLKAPVKMVSPPHIPVPFASSLEDLYIPNASSVADAVAAITPDKVSA